MSDSMRLRLQQEATYELPNIREGNPNHIHEDISRVLIDTDTIKSHVEMLGMKIRADYRGQKPLLICILQGAAAFCDDLMQIIGHQNCEVDTAILKTYDGDRSTGELQIKQEITTNITDRPVILVEDIVDTGFTLGEYQQLLQERAPSSVQICTLLHKPEGRIPAYKNLRIEYIGFEIDNVFAVGYGLDYKNTYRDLPYIGELKKELYT